MNGYEYEQACAAYLRKKGFRDVQVTQASRDQGADIIAVRKREKYAIQCKYYATPVGNKAVQEVYAAATFYGCDRAVVMTNNTFTRGAIELAESLGVELMPGVEPGRRRIGVTTVLMLLVEMIAVGMLCMVWLKPDAPFLPATYWEENGEGILTSAGLIAAGGLLYFAQWYMMAAILCLCGSFGSVLYLFSTGGWTYVMTAAGAIGALISLLRAIVTKVSGIFRKPEGSEAGSPAVDVPQEGMGGARIPADIEDDDEQSDAETMPDPYDESAAGAKAADATELSILYDLVGIAERGLYEARDPNERREIMETLGEAYAFLIAHEEEIPKEWESPEDRWEQLQSAMSHMVGAWEASNEPGGGSEETHGTENDASGDDADESGYSANGQQ